MTGASRSGHRVALVGILCVAAALRFALASHRPIWIDEVYRLAWAHGCHPSNFYDVRSRRLCINRHPGRLADVLQVVAPFEPPLDAIVLNRWMHGVGAASDLGVRVPLVIFGLLTILAFHRLGAEVAGPRTGLIASALVALSPFHVYYSEEINNYALAACCVAFSYLFYFRMLRGAGPGAVVGYVVATTAALFTHYYTLIAFFAQAIGVLVHEAGRWRHLVRLAVPFLVVTGAFACYVPVLARQLPYMLSQPSGPFGGGVYLGERLVVNILFPWIWELGNLLPLPAAVAALAFVAILFGAGLQALGPARLRAVIAINAVLPLVVIAAGYVVRRNNQILWPRYGLFFTFAALLPTAAFWGEGRRSRGRALAGVLALGLLGAGLGYLFGGTWQRDWRRAADIVGHAGSADQGVIVYRPNLVFALGRYLEPSTPLFGVDDGPTLPLQVAAAADGLASTWTAFAWDEGSPLPAAVRSMLACRYAFQDDFQMWRLSLSRYHDDPAPDGSSRRTTCGPRNGFLPAGGECVVETGAEHPLIRGWIDPPGPRDSIELLVDERATAVARTDVPVGEAHQEGPPRIWFEHRLDLGTAPEGSLHWLGVRVHGADGAVQSGQEILPCVKRSAIAVAGTGGAELVQGWLSSPTSGKQFRQGERVQLNGWVFSTRGIREIVFDVDGEEVQRSHQHGFARPDVAAGFPQVDPSLATNSGFVAQLDTSRLPPGPHVVTAAVANADGSLSPFRPARRFEVAAASP